LSCEAIELCRPSPPRHAKTARAGDPASGARHRFCLLPWAYALGYLLDAPTTLGHQGKGDINRRESYLACTRVSTSMARLKSCPHTCLDQKIPDRTKRSGSLRGTQGSLSGVDGDASVRALCGTDAAGLHRDKDVIVEGIGGDAMRVAVGGHVLQPGVGLGVDHAHHRSSGHVLCRQVPALLAGVEPRLVHAANGGDGR